MPWPRRNPSPVVAAPAVAVAASAAASATAVADPSSAPRPPRTARQIETEPIAPRSREWQSAVFDHIEWRRFEALCEALYGQAGVRTQSQSHGADGGVDIWLHLQHASKPMIVQCKHWVRKVGVDDMRAFFGVLKSHDLDRGIFATSSH
ncbi:MAG: restriction endonuclease, partial [Comamonadaceae bacterium]